MDFDEGRLTRWLGDWLDANTVQYWVTFNGARYDYPTLFWRGARHGVARVRDEFRFRAGRYGDPRLLDLYHILGEDGSLDAWAEFFGIEQDNPISGGDIATCISRGQHDLVLRHAKSRVTTLRAIHQKFR
jgi:hypothetical protein